MTFRAAVCALAVERSRKWLKKAAAFFFISKCQPRDRSRPANVPEGDTWAVPRWALCSKLLVHWEPDIGS